MTAEDAGTAVRRNENADSEPDGNDFEEVSFEVVAPPKGNVGKDGVAEVCDEDANADVSFPKVDLLTSELVLFWPPPGFKFNMLLLINVVGVINPKLLFPALEDGSARENGLEVFSCVVVPKENDGGIVFALQLEPEVPAEEEPNV